MARSDLFNYDNLQNWMEAVAETLQQTVLFRTHDDGAGGASDSPIFRLKPTQVVVYDLFTASRHVANDGNKGAAASHTLIGGATVDLDGEVQLLATLSGSTGSLQADTNMLALRALAQAGDVGVGVQYDASGGTITDDNTMSGIWHILLSLNSFGEAPVAVIETHTHEDNDNGGTLGRNALSRTDISFAGTIGTSSWVTFALNPYSFFPMIHVTRDNIGTWSPWLNGHDVDAADADSPRFGIGSDSFGSGTYDIDVRSIDA